MAAVNSEKSEIEAFAETYDEFEEYLSDSDDECAHQETDSIGGITVCSGCGLKLNESLMDNENRYYGAADNRYSKDPTRHHQRKDEDRTLYSDLEHLKFPQEIIERANDYYKKIIQNRIYRAKNRMSIVFACVFHAYKDMNEPRTPDSLAKVFGLKRKGISKGLKTFADTFKGKPDKKYITAIDLVPKLLSDLEIDNPEYFKDIKEIYGFVEARSRLFKSSNPQSVAAGIVYYYLKLNNSDITRPQFSSKVGLTDITFTKIARDASQYFDAKVKI